MDRVVITAKAGMTGIVAFIDFILMQR